MLSSESMRILLAGCLPCKHTVGMCKTRKRPELAKTNLIAELPAACGDETAAVEFLERRRWGDSPACPKCGSARVYKMSGKDGQRSARFLWRCRDCKGQYTVRTGTVYAESLVPLHKWVRCLWECSTAKAGCSALELGRRLQVQYKTALFMMNRVRHAMAQDANAPMLTGVVEADETYVGARKPRIKGTHANPINKRGSGTKKQPVAAVLQRGGIVRTRVVTKVNAHNIKAMLSANVDPSARLMTDQAGCYTTVGPMFASHETVNHMRREYARGEVHTNSIEGFFARVKRGMNGVFHAVSKRHLHRYMSQFEFLHNTRMMNDGERTLELLRLTEGKRLMYRDPVAAR